MNNLLSTVIHTHTISRVVPHYFSSGRAGVQKHFDHLLECETVSIDLAHLFWGRKLDPTRLATLVAAADFQDESRSADPKRQIDRQAIDQLHRAKKIIASVDTTVPSARALLFAYRVLSRCVSVASEFECGFRLHVARGVVLTDRDQYSFSDILGSARAPADFPLGKCIDSLIRTAEFEMSIAEEGPKIHIINLRNDGELLQAVLVASLFKQRFQNVVTILDASGANEQFNFGEWADLFEKHREDLSLYFDYFLPKQDYKATLRTILRGLLAGKHPELCTLSNLVALTGSSQQQRECATVPSLDEAFRHYIENAPVFEAFGERTLLARLVPSRCHWSGCSFCTINSQHPLPQGLTVPDERLREHMHNLFSVVRRKQVRSLILMDEALHPNILHFLAQSIIDEGLSVVYRARARFSNAFTPPYCELLYLSGCRYLGMGLEAASPRVNALINKHRGAEIDYRSVLDNMDAAGIRAHVYAILGFPTETRDEIQATFEFLLSSIRRYRYLTVSPNLFYLMKGSGMAQHPEQFGLKIGDVGDGVGLVLSFTEPEHDANLDFSRDAVRRLHQAQFLPNVDDPEFAEEFWHFVDQTGIFYLQKVALPASPFKGVGRNPGAGASLEQYASLSDLFSIETSQAGDEWLLCDWVTNNFSPLPGFMRTLIAAYDESLSVQENINSSVDLEKREIAAEICTVLLEHGFLIPSIMAQQCAVA